MHGSGCMCNSYTKREYGELVITEIGGVGEWGGAWSLLGCMGPCCGFID